jgi:hypothetical protein
MKTNIHEALPHRYVNPLVGLSEAFIDHCAMIYEERRKRGDFRNPLHDFESFMVGAVARAEEGALL